MNWMMLRHSLKTISRKIAPSGGGEKYMKRGWSFRMRWRWTLENKLLYTLDKLKYILDTKKVDVNSRTFLGSLNASIMVMSTKNWSMLTMLQFLTSQIVWLFLIWYQNLFHGWPLEKLSDRGKNPNRGKISNVANSSKMLS